MKLRLAMRKFFTKHQFFLTLCIFLCFDSLLEATTEWTALIYVQANNNLNPFALKNFSDMASIGSNQNVTTLVQWYQPGHQGIWRYKIEKGKMILEECNQIPTDGNTAADLVDAMRWAVTKYPAQKYSLVLWDHGIGIIDPLWGKQQPWQSKVSFELDEDIIKDNPRIQIDGITMYDGAISFSQPLEITMTTTQRGILFNEHSRTYMDNQNLAQALHDIKTKVLNGKKIDLLGMDACLMAMVEISYLAYRFANVLVASQEVELAHGWNYADFITLLSGKNTSVHNVAQGIVLSYENYYKDKVQFYTQSAVNLEHMNQLKENIDTVITAFKNCANQNKNSIIDIAKKARRACLQFSAASYVDLYTFYSEFLNQLNNIPQAQRLTTHEQLKASLAAGMKLIEQSIIANTAGKNLARAKGLSIYFPQNRIDASYQKTDFAKECQWFGFIKEMCGVA